jgi:hypothetical protein
MIVYLNDDGTLDVAHNTSNPDNRTNPKGNSEELKYGNVKEFENDWGGPSKLQYVPIEEPKEETIKTGSKED